MKQMKEWKRRAKRRQKSINFPPNAFCVSMVLKHNCDDKKLRTLQRLNTCNWYLKWFSSSPPFDHPKIFTREHPAASFVLFERCFGLRVINMSQKWRDKHQLHTNCDDFMRESFTFIFYSQVSLNPRMAVKGRAAWEGVKSESKVSPRFPSLNFNAKSSQRVLLFTSGTMSCLLPLKRFTFLPPNFKHFKLALRLDVIRYRTPLYDAN